MTEKNDDVEETGEELDPEEEDAYHAWRLKKLGLDKISQPETVKERRRRRLMPPKKEEPTDGGS